MKDKKFFAVILSVLMVLSIFVPFTSEAYGYTRRDSHLVDLRYTSFKESRPNPEFTEWQNRQQYGNFGASSEEYNGVVPEPVKLAFGKSAKNQRFERLGFPASYDLRDYNKVSPIRDQGPNGSCWTFACYSSLESTLRPAEELDFSEKHMRNTHSFDWGPEKGGNRFISTAYLARWSGPILEEDDPYSPYDFHSPDGLERAKDLRDVEYLPDTTDDFEIGVNAIKQAIMDHGAVQTAMYASDRYLNKDSWAHYYPRRGNGNHAVAIIGWDDNYSKDNFVDTPPRDGAWLIRNSWGTSMGIDGYYWISYYDTVTGTNNALYFAKDKGDHDKIYQYDPFGMTRTVGYNGKGYAANVFGPVKQTEYVNGAGFYVPAEDTDYKVYVVKDYDGPQSLAEERIEVASGNVEYPGYHTVKFDNVEVKPNDRFAVVVYFYTLNSYYPIAIEARERQYASRVNAYPGQSFTSEDGSKWTDLTTYNSSANVCVKGFTTFDGTPSHDEDVKKVTGIKLSQNKAQLERWDRLNLKYEITPADAKNKAVSWTSSDPSVARVDNYGSVLAMKDGVATITVETADGGFKDECVVTVGKEAPAEVKVTSVSLDKRYMTIEAGKEFQLAATVYPQDATNKEVEFSSSNERVATVDSEGNVRAIRPGYAYIYAKSVDGPSAYCYLTVKESSRPEPKVVKVSTVTLDKRYLTLEEGENYELTATLNPSDATNKEVKFSSSNERVATVDGNGNIVAVRPGYAYIYAKSADGPYAYCYVSVKAASRPEPKVVKVSSVTLDKRYLTLDEGKDYELVASVYPQDATNKELTFSSSDERVATVDNNGVVTAVGAGRAYIFAKSADGPSASVYVTVRRAYKPEPKKVEVTNVTFEKRYIRMNAGETYELTATVYPNNATDKTITYTSSNEKAAKVDENGVITAVERGSAYITAKSVNGVEATCYVDVYGTTKKVVKKVQSVYFGQRQLSLKVGETKNPGTYFAPADATNKDVTYSSLNSSIATVDEEGNITAVRPGQVYISVRSADGPQGYILVNVTRSYNNYWYYRY